MSFVQAIFEIQREWKAGLAALAKDSLKIHNLSILKHLALVTCQPWARQSESRRQTSAQQRACLLPVALLKPPWSRWTLRVMLPGYEQARRKHDASTTQARRVQHILKHLETILLEMSKGCTLPPHHTCLSWRTGSAHALLDSSSYTALLTSNRLSKWPSLRCARTSLNQVNSKWTRSELKVNSKNAKVCHATLGLCRTLCLQKIRTCFCTVIYVFASLPVSSCSLGKTCPK